MSKVSFFTPVEYLNTKKTVIESCREKVDAYFHWSGKKAYIIKTASGKEKAIMQDAPVSLLATAAKVLSCFTIIIPLMMLAAKLILRLPHSFKLVDVEKKLGKGIELGGAREDIQRLMPEIMALQDHADIEWLSKGNNQVFKLPGHPHLVFKAAPCSNGSVIRGSRWTRFEDLIKERFARSKEAYAVTLVHQLGLLVIPKTKMFEVEHQGRVYQVIAEECLEFNRSASAQERNYEVLDGLDESVRQLSTFISKFKFSDVTPRNIPILDDNPRSLGNRRIGLIDVEDNSSAKEGFVGGENGSCGLIGTVGASHVDAVIEHAHRFQVDIDDSTLQQARQQRLAQLEEQNRLYQFYSDNEIVNGNEPVDIDLDTLDIDLDEEGEITVPKIENDQLVYEKQTVTMRDLAQLMKDHINTNLQNRPANDALHGKRQIVILTDKRPFVAYDHLGTERFSRGRAVSDAELHASRWLKRVGQAFIDAGYLFAQGRKNGVDYVQA